MSEIEKMYKLANVKAISIAEYGSAYIPDSIEIDGKLYPPFSAEKQLELIKWLIQKYKTVSIEHKLNLFYINIIDIYTGMVHIEFDETIAGLINNLWLSLSEEEKQQVKGNLE